MANKIILSVVSVFLVVGVVIGVVATVNRDNGTKPADNGPQINSHNKAVTALCTDADDRKLCNDVLTPVNSSDPKDYVDKVVKTTLDSVIKAFNMSDKLTIEHGAKNNGIKMALDDCKDLLQSALHELEATGVFVQGGNVEEIVKRSADLKNWLGAVIAYQQSCLDGFNTDGEKKIQSQLQTGSLDSVGKLTALALDVVSGVSNVLSSLNLNLNLNSGARRLLSQETDFGAIPSWLSASDRKLMAAKAESALIPHVTVAKDGSGQFKTILEAINSYPKVNKGRYIIYVKEGVYAEYITVDKKKSNILMYGDGPTKTIITGRKNFAEGVKTMRTATFATVADDFIAKGIAFENTAGPSGHQAVALRVAGDRSAFFDCAIRGYQDTLYTHVHRSFFRNCEISGTIDFIFGYGSALIQNSKILVRKPNGNQRNIIVADGTDQKNMPSGIVLHNCEILPDNTLQADRLIVKSFLARPWKPYSKAVFIENTIGDFIQPEGYIPWAPAMPNTEFCYFAEFGNTGPGANAAQRAKFSKGLISKAEAQKFTAQTFLTASEWLPATGIPFDSGFIKA